MATDRESGAIILQSQKEELQDQEGPLLKHWIRSSITSSALATLSRNGSNSILTPLRFVSLYLDSKTLWDLFSTRVWQASYLWPNLYPLVLWSALSTGFSPARLSPLLFWCLYSRQPSPSLPPAFILRSRRRQTLLASQKTDPGLLWSSSQPCSAPVRVWMYFLIAGGQSCIWCSWRSLTRAFPITVFQICLIRSRVVCIK